MPDSKKLDTEQWLERYGDMMYRYTLLRVREQDSAEEIVQATFLAALQSAKSYAGHSTEKSWLFGILKHKIMDHFRERKKHQTYNLSEDDDSDPFENAYDKSGHWKNPPHTWGLNPEKVAENKQLRDTLNKCLDGLSDKFRNLFILKEIEGLETEAICKELGIQPTNLWVILHRARNKLKKCLEYHWFNKA